jgi:F-type H+-transporting ATPase subunit epsilon
MALRLRLITPTRTLVETDVEQVTAPGSAGEFGVLPEHVAFVGELGDGVLTYVEKGLRKRVLVLGGYAEVADDVMTVLADDAALPEEVDPAKTRDELARVQAALDVESSDAGKIDTLLREQRRLEIQLAVAS